MRISDWSSDVCSSDLSEQRRPRDEERALARERAERDALDRPARAAEADDQPAPRRAIERLFPGCPADAVEDHGAALAAGDLMHARHDILAAAVDDMGCACLAGARSEEHTSELQSLMRISYAVFCLKKKNRKTN